MAKLTEKQRQEAKQQLTERVVKAIDLTPKGLTNKEICGAILQAGVEAGVMS